KVYGIDYNGVDVLDVSQQAVLERIQEAQKEFMEADSPAGMSATANQIAVGVYSSDTAFRYIEVYSESYLELSEDNPSEIVGSEVTICGTVPSEHALGPYCCLVYHDPPPSALESATIREKHLGPYFDFSDSKAVVVWPWEINFNVEDGKFSVPISFDSVPEAGTYYVQIYLKDKPEDIPYAEKQDGLEVPGDGAFCATGLILAVDQKAPDMSPDKLELNMHIEAGTIEERQAKSMAVIASQNPDPKPISTVEALAGVGLVVPDSEYEQNLFVPVERQESGTIANLTVAFKRMVNDEEGSDELGISKICFVEGIDGEDAVVPEGMTIVGGDLCKMVAGGDADGEEKKNEDVLAGSPSCFLCVEKAEIGSGVPLIVDLAIVYAQEMEGEGGFDMGAGYETTQAPNSVTDVFKSPIFLCTKVQGAGKEAADAMAEQTAMIAQEEIQNQMEDNSLASEEKSLQEFDLDVDLSKEEMLAEERERAEKMALAAAQDEHDAQERAEQAMLTNLEENISNLESDRDSLTKEHAELQRKLAAHLASQKRRENTDRANEKESMAAHEMEKQYNDTLTSIVLGEEKLNNQKTEYDKIAIDLQTRLDEKECKANDISQAFRDFKREISKGSENSRTGKPMPKSVIKQFEEAEMKKDEEAERVRLKNINLKMTVKKLENQLRAKEQLAEGLHLIDFEQLKIENQTLNEKIEERNEELHKLRKKNTTTVQVLTHIKEKLQSVQADNAVTRGSLGDLDANLAQARDRLTRLKRDRDSARAGNLALKQRQGFANSSLLVVDYETRKQKLVAAGAQLAELMERHAILEDTINAARGG
ncbi:hypothetical protein TrRE_jg2561, partial [Triparma retinervis]